MSVASFIAPPVSNTVDGDLLEVEFSEAMLWSGDMVVSPRPVRISTILGSCVSVCLFDRARAFGGMNHYLVPRGQESAIYGEWSTAALIHRMCQLGSDVAALEAKVFGGGSPLRLSNEQYAIGAENVVAARDVLSRHGIPIIAERVGHTAGIRVFFENWSGVAWVKRSVETK